MTAEELAFWCQSLFGGKVLQPSSLDEMMQFIDIEPFSNMTGYGLGVQVYQRAFSSGEEAIGHGGGNIGSTTYMVCLPEYQTSIVVMVNAYPTPGADYITKGLIRKATGNSIMKGWIAGIRLFPHGFLIIFVLISATTLLIFLRIRHSYPVNE
jgi:CubicO group peptidase (beta-lactamase class C family)